jgi:hypothetical protein
VFSQLIGTILRVLQFCKFFAKRIRDVKHVTVANHLLLGQYDNGLGVEGIKILAEPGGVFEKMLGLKALYMVGVTQTEWSNMRG